MEQLTHKLEMTLGPGTSELSLRIGLHSGAVTAGVLRGEKSRFQLFGDTVNTASRMESTGVANKIQVSQETADLIHRAGRQYWLTPRNGTVTAKGKGEMQVRLEVFCHHSPIISDSHMKYNCVDILGKIGSEK
jgi:class 3 adenylate cyclase